MTFKMPAVIRVFLVSVALAFPALGQGASSKLILGAGYLYPGALNVAPGQVITLFASGVGASLTGPVTAGAGTLPTSLAGISVILGQKETRVPVPILAINPGGCSLCSATRAITIQIPYELEPGLRSPLHLFVRENGVDSPLQYLNFQADQVHILTDCDTVIGGNGPSTGRCPWEVRHGNGTLVSKASPATEGEVLVMYAVGLGQTNPPAETGVPPTQPAPTVAPYKLGFRFKANELPSPLPLPSTHPASAGALPPPVPQDIEPLPAPLYAGLTVGFPGLYQINFVVPPVPAGLPPCADGEAPLSDLVNTNMTVNVVGWVSFDGALLCVSVRK